MSCFISMGQPEHSVFNINRYINVVNINQRNKHLDVFIETLFLSHFKTELKEY